MTKADNKAAAKAWSEYHEEQRRKTERAAGIEADLLELGRLRSYLIRGRRIHYPDAEKLRSAIDDYVGELTGDRTALHEKPARIG